MKRCASVILLDADGVEKYERLHADAWPLVLKRINESNIRNYSIFRFNLTLFSYFEYVGEDFDADTAAMAEDPETQRWWDVCKPLQRPVSEATDSEWWHDIPEVFHVD